MEHPNNWNEASEAQRKALTLELVRRHCDYLVAEGFAYYHACPDTGEQLISLYTPQELEANLRMV